MKAKLGVLVILILLVSVTPAEGAPPATGGTVHIVQWGETLATIAYHYGTTVEAIVQANGLTNPHLIQVGQRLIIPGSAAPSSPSGSTHTVRQGDTLFSIGRRYGVTVNAITQANGLTSTLIYVGQELTIPPAGSVSPPTENPTDVAWTRYTVQPGDTLTTIACRYGITVNDIVQANNLYNPGYIYPGQTLIIPAGQMRPPTQPAATYYTVQSGDTLASIALRYGTTVYALMHANNLSNPSFIYPGQQLVIPGMAPPPAGPQPPLVQGEAPLVPGQPAVDQGSKAPIVPTSTPSPRERGPRFAKRREPPEVTMAWQGHIVSNEVVAGPYTRFPSVLRVSVGGTKGQAVKVTEAVSGWYTIGLSGTKPEYGPFTCEFAPLNEATYIVSLPGLDTSLSIDIKPNSLAYVEFANAPK
jgi:LysM repeat protein